MTNKELLINAARAGEVEGVYYIAYGEREANEGIDISGGKLWNPLTSNADAFTLMVSLYVDLRICDLGVYVSNPDSYVSYTQPIENKDREKATRLAITHCAAIIGDNL